MNRQEEIILHLENVDQLVDPFAPSPFLKRRLREDAEKFIIREGLTILAWIALWRPGELLLYEWYPFRRDAKLFGKLERAEMQVIAEVKEASR